MFEQGQIFAERYTIEELLGEGGFSYVFKATQLGLGRSVALKIIHARRLNMPLPDSSNQALDRLHERFEQEARTISQLASPHTVTLYDYGIEASGCPFMVLEYIDGMDLADLIYNEGKQEPERVVEMMRQVLESLAEAHAYGLLHRDIKPANIVMTRDVRGRDQVKLLDFGLAKVFATGDEVRRDLTSESQIIGTPRYMSPEQIMTPRELTAASDLYSLGLVGYELLTGRPAVDGVDTMSLIASQISKDSFALVPSDGVPPALAGVIDKMLAKAASDRYASAEQVLAALDAAMMPDAVAPASPPAPGMSSERKLIFASLGIIMLAFVLGCVILIQSMGGNTEAEVAESPGSEVSTSSVASKEPVAPVKDPEKAPPEAPEDKALPEDRAPPEDTAAVGSAVSEGGDAKPETKPGDAPEVEPPAVEVRPDEKDSSSGGAKKKTTRSPRKTAKSRPSDEKIEPTKKTAPKVDAFIMEP